MPKKLWLTYSWKDNEQQDVDFIAQELRAQGIEVRLDRWNLVAGQRLWEQLDRFITHEAESDAWMIFATPNSLGSEACREEVAYALDRALSKRGTGFPIIGLFASSANLELFPASLRTRLCVNLEDPDWKERVRAACNREGPAVSAEPLAPYVLTEHQMPDGVMLEFRPRSGLWVDFSVGIPSSEGDKLKWVAVSTPGKPALQLGGTSSVGTVRFAFGNEAPVDMRTICRNGIHASPAASGFAMFSSMPSAIVFGSASGDMYWIKRNVP